MFGFRLAKKKAVMRLSSTKAVVYLNAMTGETQMMFKTEVKRRKEVFWKVCRRANNFSVFPSTFTTHECGACASTGSSFPPA